MAGVFTDEVREFLTAGTRTGNLAWTAADGRPLVVPIWFLLEGDDVVFNMAASSAKAKGIRRDPRVCLSVDMAHEPFAFVQIQGTATLSDDLVAMLPYSTAISARYMGADRAEEFGRRNAVPGELLVRVAVTKVNFSLDMTA